VADLVFFFLVDDVVWSLSVVVPSITTDFFRDNKAVEDDDDDVPLAFLVELELDFFFFFSGMAGKVKDMGILEQVVVLSPNNIELLLLLLLPPPNELLLVLAVLLLLLLFFFLVFLSDDDDVVKVFDDLEDSDLEDAFVLVVFRSELEDDR
jgi:hypothetical protein